MEHITILVTRKCNLKCEYCYQEHNEKNMSREISNQIVDIVRRYNIKNISLFGGEPLINWEIIKHIVDELTHEDVQYGLITNGLLLDDEKLDFIEKNKIALAISYDGKRTMKRAKSVGQAELIYSSLKKAISRITSLTICMTICKDNIVGLTRDAICLYEDGIKNIKFSIDSWNHKWTNQEFEILKEECRRILLHCIEKNKKGIDITFSDFKDIYMVQLGTMRCCNCKFGLDNYVIDADGHIYPCISFIDDKNNSLGLLGSEQCIKDTFDYDKMTRLKKKYRVDNNVNCKNCRYMVDYGCTYSWD